LALIPRMVAQRDGICAGIDEFVVDDLGDAETAGRIFAVDHDQIELPSGDEAREPLDHNGASGAANDIADEKDTHKFNLPIRAGSENRNHALRKSITSRSVSTRSSRASRSVAGI